MSAEKMRFSERWLRQKIIYAYTEGGDATEIFDAIIAREGAAPELLEALENLVEFYGRDHPLRHWVEARATIAKARGETQ